MHAPAALQETICPWLAADVMQPTLNLLNVLQAASSTGEPVPWQATIRTGSIGWRQLLMLHCRNICLLRSQLAAHYSNYTTCPPSPSQTDPPPPKHWRSLRTWTGQGIWWPDRSCTASPHFVKLLLSGLLGWVCNCLPQPHLLAPAELLLHS